MAESASSSNPPLADAGSSKKRNSEKREASSSLEHLAVLENVIHHLGGWKVVYIAKHKEQFAKISKILLEVEEWIRNDCLHSNSFHCGISKLMALATTYDDIYSFFFSKKDGLLKEAMAERGEIDKNWYMRGGPCQRHGAMAIMPEETHMRVYCLKHLVDREMSIIYLMRQSQRDHYRDKVSSMTISYNIPEPLKCMVCSQEEHLKKADYVESQRE